MARQLICVRCKKRPAVVFVQRGDGGDNKPVGYCLTCAKELGIKPVDDLIKQFGLSDQDLESMEDRFSSFIQGGGAEAMESLLGEAQDMEDDEDGEGDDFTPGGSATFPFNLIGRAGADDAQDAEYRRLDGEKESKKDPRAKEKGKKRKFLDTYCDNLTEKAKDGRLDRIIGRDKEIYRAIQILCRRQKNNPCLIGEAGVGKTAIAEGIALRIAQGKVPSRLADKEIYLLDLTALVAGTQFRGQFESRVKGLISEVKAAGNVILFIDEIHNITGAGDSEGAMNAANILKPALSRGEIQVIGATTFAEYRKYIEKDQALERRFQPVKVEEPSIEDTVAVLDGIKGYYEKHHHVKISPAIVRMEVTLSERYITDRFLPDKAIDLMDEAAACCSLRHPEITEWLNLEKRIDALEAEGQSIEQKADAEQADFERLANIKSELLRFESEREEKKAAVDKIEVEAEDVSKVIELWTGIPAVKIQQSDFFKINALESNLKKKIIGQDEAVELVAKAIKRSRAGISGRRRPASFIFVGPTGVGKTELVKQLAGELFDTVDPLIRLDMSEFMEKFAVSRLIGSPPGYVGYDEAGQLTEKVRRRPYSVVLFDEIEKAHPDVMNILLQILDEGRINDAQGRTVNFENTVICMTSNAGSSDRVGETGFNKSVAQMSKDKALKALSDFLRPEFLARVDEVIAFNPLTDADLEKIAALTLEEYRQPLRDKGIELSYTPAALHLLCEKASGGKFGARDLRRVIRKEVEDPMAEMIVGGSAPAAIRLDAETDRLLIQPGTAAESPAQADGAEPTA